METNPIDQELQENEKAIKTLVKEIQDLENEEEEERNFDQYE